jgi:hypothetical protein
LNSLLTGSLRADKETFVAEKTPTDSIEFLKTDHRKVEDLFDQFEKARTGSRKAELVEEICLPPAPLTTIKH